MSEPVHFYTVTGGRCSGIFTSWNRVLDATVGYPGAKFNKFSTLAEADFFLNEENSKGKANHAPIRWSGPAYAVAVGRRMGVFRTSHEALRQTLRYSGNSLKRFDSYEEAVEFLDHHNWRKMFPSDNELEGGGFYGSTDQFSDTESNATKENPQDAAHLEIPPKRERDENAHPEGQHPAQRLRTDTDAQFEKESVYAFCHGCIVRDSKVGETAQILCTFPVHPEWDVRQSLHGLNGTVIRAGLLAVLEALKRATREDPECEMGATIFTIWRALFDTLCQCARDGWQSANENQDLLQRISEEKRGRNLKLLHLDGSFKWNARPGEQGDDDVPLDDE
ncbi:RNA-DNA hybrid ribonuclease [Phytophthora pseudosyringae]|uniref:RNA-DNA hybrid ribonuclease n=1 Tax=Phytophthora pseudosyringae TaxID=221518 RepID=A0A8T1W053_9STRA|nr:RNA-DNA hybrid ribonuclease [Phytophthora pseudosyringae]